MAINYKQCPKCRSKNSVKIIYGMPSFELIEESEAGKIRLGGCCITQDSPEYYCNQCTNEWNREEVIHAAYDNIKGLKASVGGYFGGYYTVEIDLINLTILWSHWGGGTEEKIHKDLTPLAAKRLLKELKLLNLLDWKAKYIEPGICDGTQWNVEIIKDGRNIKKHGDNKFPDEWQEFCKHIRTIAGKRFG